MALSPEDRARIAEEERIRQKTSMSIRMAGLKKVGGCFALVLFLIIVGCTVSMMNIRH